MNTETIMDGAATVFHIASQKDVFVYDWYETWVVDIGEQATN
jgi:hypothetical protein